MSMFAGAPIFENGVLSAASDSSSYSGQKEYKSWLVTVIYFSLT